MTSTLAGAPEADPAGVTAHPRRGRSIARAWATARYVFAALVGVCCGWLEQRTGLTAPTLFVFGGLVAALLGLRPAGLPLLLVGALGSLLGPGSARGQLTVGLASVALGAAAGLAVERRLRALPERPASAFARVQVVVIPVAAAAVLALAALREATVGTEAFLVGVLRLLPGVLLGVEVVAAAVARRLHGAGVAGAAFVAAVLTVGVTAAAVGFTTADWRHQDAANLNGSAATAANVLQQTLTGDVGVLLARATNPPQGGWTTQSLFDRSSRVLLLAQPTLTALELVGGNGDAVLVQFESGSQGFDPKAAAMFLPTAADRRAVAQVAANGGFRVVGIRDVSDVSGRRLPNLIVFASVGGGSRQALGMAVSLTEALRSAGLSVGGTTGDTDFALAVSAPGSTAPTVKVVMHGGQAQSGLQGVDVSRGSAAQDFQLGDVTFSVTSHPARAMAAAQRFRRLVVAGELVGGLALLVILLQAATAAYRRRLIEAEQKELLEAAVSGAPGVVLVLDQDLRILAANDGLGTGELRAGEATLLELLPFRAAGEDESRVRQLVADALAGTEARLEVVDAAGGAKIRIFELQARPVRRGRDGTRLVWLAAVDVTEARTQDMRAEQSERLESLGMMARGLAHDFNNLLFIITGYLQLAQDRPSVRGDRDVAAYLDHAQDAAGRGAAIASSLLSVAGGGALHLSTVSLPQFFDRLEPLARRAVGDRRVLEFSEPVPDVSLVIDAAQLTNALINLLINARDATAESGHVTVRADVVGSPRAEDDGSDWVCLSVLDDGEGMSPETQTRAFEPYFTTKVPEQGTGLGLATTYAFVRHSQGEISIDSELGRGTRICILLPLTHTALPRESNAEQATVDASRVLVVDNESSLVLLVAGWLRGFGLDVRTAEAPDEALRVFDEFQPGLVVTDMNLGTDLTGLDVAAHIAFRDPDVRVVFMTGFSDQMQKLVERGLPVLAKPFGKDALRRLIGMDAAAGVDRGMEVQRV